jgi:hypothetical protein
MNYCKRKNEPTDSVHCLNCEHCLPPGERTGGRMCRDEMTDLEVFDIINKGHDDGAKNLLDFQMQCLDADLHSDPHRFDGIASLLHVDFGNTKDARGQDALSGISKEELADLLRKANRRRKSAERTVRKMRSTIRRINDDAMTAISSRQRIIEVQWEVMRELQRRGLVSTEDLETVLRAVKHVVNYNRQQNCPIGVKVKM